MHSLINTNSGYRLIICSVIILIVFSSLHLNVSAVAYDEADLKATLEYAIDLYTSVYEDSNHIAEFSFDPNTDYIEIIKNPRPEDEKFPYQYHRRGGNFRIWDDFIAELSICFNEELTKKFVYCAPVAKVNEFTYSPVILGMSQCGNIYLEWRDDRAGIDVSLDKSFEIVSATDECIMAKFTTYHYEKVLTYDYTVEYTKTGMDWRISGGSFFDEYIKMNEWSPNYESFSSPQTGFATVAYAAVAVVSAAAAVTLAKKRRR